MNSSAIDLLKDKPYFTLKIDADSAPHIVDVNGITVSSDMESSPVSMEIPINHWIKSGANEITLTLVNFEDQPIRDSASVKISFQVKPTGHAKTETRIISRLEYSGALSKDPSLLVASSTKGGKYDSRHSFYADENGDVTISAPKFSESADGDRIYRQTITLDTPFPEWAFFNSDVLPQEHIDTMPEEEYQKFLQGPYEIYKKISDLLATKNIAAVMKLFHERNKEYDIAYFNEPGSKEKELTLSLTKIVNRPKTKMVEVKKEFLATFFHPNKKLLKLETSDRGDAIAFNLADIQSSQHYEILLRREKGQWIITR